MWVCLSHIFHTCQPSQFWNFPTVSHCPAKHLIDLKIMASFFANALCLGQEKGVACACVFLLVMCVCVCTPLQALYEGAT